MVCCICRWRCRCRWGLPAVRRAAGSRALPQQQPHCGNSACARACVRKEMRILGTALWLTNRSPLAPPIKAWIKEAPRHGTAAQDAARAHFRMVGVAYPPECCYHPRYSVGNESTENLTKSGVSLGQHKNEVHKNVPNAANGVSRWRPIALAADDGDVQMPIMRVE